MSMFEQPVLLEEADHQPAAVRGKQPKRWSPSNWSVRWKVVAIVVIPIALAMALGGLRVYSSVTDARDLRVLADRADMVGPIQEYAGAMESALLAYGSGTDGPVARKVFDDTRAELQRKLSATNVDPDVRTGITRILNNGPELLDRAASNGIGLRDTVTMYAPILLTAEDVIVGSVRVNDEKIRAQAQGLSRAVGARGQMFMQKLLINRGGEIPEPELRTSMITLAGTEPSTLFGMSLVLGVGSPDAKMLQDQMVNRMAIISDPSAVLVGNPDLLQSLQTTEDMAKRVIGTTTSAVTSAVGKQASDARTAAIRDSAIVAGAILAALILVLLVARSLVRPLRRLREGALRVAHEELPAEIERINAGEAPGAIQPIPVHSTEEIGQVAHAVDDLHEQALLMAAEQSRLQLHVSDMFETMSRRNRSLVDQQLALIDDLERNEDDPKRLSALFRLDHLAARMRRNGTNLLVLAGAKIRREHTESMPIADVIGAAASHVEDYQRVVIARVPDSAVDGSAAGDIVHLLAEVIDNALHYSPPRSEVRVSAVHTGKRGIVVEVSDAGLGMTESDIRIANTRLESGGEVTPYTTRHMGLFVVSRLARQHGLVVRMRSSVPGEPRSGMTVGVFIPAELMAQPETPGWPGSHEDRSESPPAPPMAPEVAVGVHDDSGFLDQQYRNGNGTPQDEPVLPRRDPGASGIVGAPEMEPPAEVQPEPVAEAWPEEVAEAWPEPVDEVPAQPRVPADTSAFFTSREHVPEHRHAVPEEQEEPQEWEAAADEGWEAVDEDWEVAPEQPAPARTRPPSSPLGDTDVIFQRMVSEWLVDPSDLMEPFQSWESVWDSGWTAAAQADEAPVEQHTEQGLPVRDPGARLVPGSADSPDDDWSNGGAPAGDETAGYRDPDAVRASLSSHWSGVRAGRSHARDDDWEDRE